MRLLATILPLRARPDLAVFTNTNGQPIEPKAFSRHWYDCLRALGIRQRVCIALKDTFVSAALDADVKKAWLESQTGVNYETPTPLR